MNKKFNKTIIILSLFIFGTYIRLSAQRIAAGGWHSLAVCTDSTVKAFGENATGQLGDNTTTDKSTPVQVSNLTGIVAVSAGGDQLEAHSMALKADGTVWAWGSNLYGGLGNGTTNSTLVPVQTLLLSDVMAISAGGWHSSALKKDSTVWTWGWNMDGQLGDGTTNDRSLPAKVNGLSGIKQIAAGTYHMLALKSDGTVWAWGDNVSGQIGNGTKTDQLTPVQVSGITDVVRIAAGRFFSLAVKSDGTVWTWGENLYGQLGNGNTTDQTTPVQVSGLTGITDAITATGAFHCLAVKNDNTVWAWGRNTYGNLGDGTTTSSSVPVKMQNASSIAGMAAGTNFSLLYKSDGTFWACGRNASGQLGDGTVLQRNTIVQATALCPIVQNVGIEQIAFRPFDVYPNPSVSGEFYITTSQFDDQNEICKIQVLNSMGEVILVNQIKIDNQATILLNLNEFSSGVYMVSIVIGEHSYFQKIIKS